MERDFATGARTYLLCNPHNPTGLVLTRDELKEVAALADRYDVRVVVDEILAPLAYPGTPHIPFLCLRCPMLNINPKMLPRLDEIEADLLARRSRAEHEAWPGEVEGIDLTLTFLRQKREQVRRLTRIAPIDLGLPTVRSSMDRGQFP